MKVGLIKKTNRIDCGVGRYSTELAHCLLEAGHDVVEVTPIVPLPRGLLNVIYRLLGWDLEAFFRNYPLWIRYPEADVYHLASQNLATLMIFHKPPGKTVVTVLDLINLDTRSPTQLPNFHKFTAHIFELIALVGIKRVNRVITISNFSKHVLQNYMALKSTYEHLI